MKILLIGRKDRKEGFEALARILTLENVKTEILCFEEINRETLLPTLFGADIYLISPETEISEDDLPLNNPCSICRLEAIVMGFAIAQKGRMMLLVRAGDSPELPFSGLPVVKSLGEAISYFRRAKKEFESTEVFREAREIISAASLSFSGKGMIEAVKNEMMHEVEAFLRVGFATDTEDSDGVPVISWAVRKGSLEICRLLLSYNASVNVIARDRTTTPLIDAVSSGNHELAVILMDAGADLDFRNRNGQTALIITIGNRMLDLARDLIDKGADISISDSLGMNAAGYAKLFSMTELEEYLSSKIS